ncbi:glutamine amidotransferase-related protein [Agrobacterium fabrum]|uniref:glutamine amidotransferase-related protein n=1 Tax=Agrobacterium fabrum TaxID=1176649 RepID=UPI001573C23C|nr:gamma-glutamyl-gamma-aminobutyrate hydrolase family protein [Agrobacterium fabrum]WIE30789.1 gamma-glutamyl-gamma-aminobutyrate hydrolase family protein [Agrobacterium fabrum]WIE46736.1 gamma-glutamyl-gamma-aminobutyrate hydrolase family protein [Agrobacterium fabrum]
MGLILVHHDTGSPALYGAAAAAVAVRRNCGFMHLASRFDTKRHADAEQHVVASGGLAASGLCWFERLSGKPIEPVAPIEAVIDAAREADIVVPIHPAFLADANAIAGLFAAAQLQAVSVETIRIADGVHQFADDATGTVITWRDQFGRIRLDKPKAPTETVLTIALVGARSDHVDVYPAALASLADAADSLRLPLAINFIDPVGFDEAYAEQTLRPYAGILLPGGANMKNVAGQTAVAAFALENQLPIVGLCLGMQTMATAVAWRAFGRRNANLAEADPDVGIKTFLAMAGGTTADGGPLPEHRTGDQQTVPTAGTRLAGLIPHGTIVRCNHRYRLNPDLVRDMETHGLRVAARGVNGSVVDAIEVVGHPFYMGMQGHPELSSRPDAPHPLLVAFLEAALRSQSQAS